MLEKTITAIGTVKSPFKTKFGLPRQSGRIKELKGYIDFYPPYNSPDAFRFLEGFTHIWVIFGFNKAETEKFCSTVRPPRLGGNARAGVFATRSPFRPNGLGLSLVKIEKINLRGGKASLEVSGIDILDGSPVYDIKPYLPTADRAENAKGGFADAYVNHRLKVNSSDKLCTIPAEDAEVIVKLIEEDPRPSYKTEACEYAFDYKNYAVKFTADNDVAAITQITVNKE